MGINYPWFAPPAREKVVVRQRPGNDPKDVIVLEWEGEQFVGAHQATLEERGDVWGDESTFATAGLFDIQINGYKGRGFKDEDLGPEGIRDLCWSILLSGTTSFMPTITTDAPETQCRAMATIAAACRQYPEVDAMITGIHQEGPWISPVNGPRGAHRPEYVISPDLEILTQLEQAADGRLKLITIAPEVPGMIPFIRQMTERGLTVSLGHHQADNDTIRRAVETGARCVTHLGNGCSTMMARHPNILWTQAAEDRLYAGIISDGHHLPPETVKVLYRAKPKDRLILVSDAISMAGAPAGLYYEQDADAIAELTPGGWYGFYGTKTLMGAAVPLGRCLANFGTFVGENKSPVDYMAHVTSVPAALLGVPTISASLGQAHMPATFVIWRWDQSTPNLVPQRIVLKGRTVYDVEAMPIDVPFGKIAKSATLQEAENWLSTQQRVQS